MLNKIIHYSLKNRIFIISIAAFICVYGGIALKQLPIDVFPDLNRPTITLMTEAPGMAPEEVEVLVTYPLESHLSGIPGVQRMRSNSGIGLSVIYIEFDWNTEIFKNRQLVQEKLLLAKEKLPKNITPHMGPIASIMGEIQLIGLSSDADKINPVELRTFADWTLRPKLLSIPGVTQVIAIGGGVKQYHILLSANKIQKFQLSIKEIEHNLSDMSKNSTGGFMESDQNEYLIRTIGNIKSKEDILSSVVGMHLGNPILVRDIGEVQESYQIKRGDGSINGKPAVIVSVQKQPGADTISITKEIDRILNELKPSVDQNIHIQANLFKQATFIETAIKNIQIALRDGMILVFIVLFIFLLNFRTTLITMTAIPLSFLLTIIVFKIFGITVNTMTLGGLAIAMGELVDDAIIDVENVFRRLKENQLKTSPSHPLKVIYHASSEVRNSIVIATVIVCLVFVPLFSMGGIEGRLFAPLGFSYIIALLSSMVISLTLTPVLCYYLLSPQKKLNIKLDNKFVEFLKAKDEFLLNFSFQNPKIVIGLLTGLFIFSVFLFFQMGRDFLPKFNEGTATITLMAQPGLSLEESNKIGTQAEKIILDSSEVSFVSRRTGRAELDEHAEGVHYSEMDVDFHPHAQRSKEAILEEIRNNLLKIKNVSINMGQPISHRLDHMLSGIRAQIVLKLFGPELNTLKTYATHIENAIKDINGVVDLQVEQQVLIPQIKIQLLREEISRLGLVLGDITELLEKALHGVVVGHLIESQKIVEIVMKFDQKTKSSIEDIKSTPIKIMPDGSLITVDQIADVYQSNGPNIIQRENGQRRIVIHANTQQRDIKSVILEIKKNISEKVKLPENYTLLYDGQYESQKNASQLMILLAVISIMGVFLILYAYFKSVFIAFQIMLNIPMAFIGGVIGIWLSGNVISLASMVAFVTLCGIASRNGIMMISHYLHLMKYEGETFSKNMVIRGSQERLVPVLMTALTAILALIPIVIFGGEPGKEILFPVAVVIIGGLISSTLLDIFVTPTIFYHFGKKSAELTLVQFESKTKGEKNENNIL